MFFIHILSEVGNLLIYLFIANIYYYSIRFFKYVYAIYKCGTVSSVINIVII